MTNQEALEESIRVYGLVKDWSTPTPWGREIARRWAELLNYGLGNTPREPDPNWTEKSVAHLDGSPDMEVVNVKD